MGLRIGLRGSMNHQHSAPKKYRVPQTYSGADQLAYRVSMSAATIGLRKPPTCPAVFMHALTTPAWLPAISTQVPQLAPRRKLEKASPSEISATPRKFSSIDVPAINSTLARSSDMLPTPHRPILKPNLLVKRSVVIPPKKSASTLINNGKLATTPSVVEVNPRSFSR